MTRIKPRKGNHIELHKRNEAELVREVFKLQNELKAANEEIIRLRKERPEWIMKNQ